ncbi:MAG: hypothetical protein JWN95_2814 [Frankiales bacterium]|nr:hypothetical protein [Frankiales bacterium]
MQFNYTPVNLPEGERRDAVQVMLGFARTLRHAGVPASQDRVHAMLTALSELDITQPDDVYWAGRMTLCSDPEDLERYDTGFALYFGGHQAHQVPVTQSPALPRNSALDRDDADVAAGEEEEDQPDFTVQASRHEVLRSKDVVTLTPLEREQLRRLFALLAPRTSGRRSRRYGPASRGAIDRSRSVRRMLRSGGEPDTLLRRRRRTTPRRLVLLIDVSGSMSSYADLLLRFAHAATRATPARTEVFTLGTRLTRITRELRIRDPDRALTAAGSAVPDWSGGTRLGDTLRAFLDRWGQRGVARGAVVVLCSDGWERGETTELSQQLARLARLAHKFIWVNPHKGKDGFAPLTAGMVAALPYVDELVAGHSFKSLEELVRVIADA